MTKKTRLRLLEEAAERLQYTSKFAPGFNRLSCLAVDYVFGSDFMDITEERKAYDKAVVATKSARSIVHKYTKETQLARQLAVLMYREGIKRGKYE